MAANPIFVGTPKRGMAQILNATASALVAVVTAGASGSKVVSLIVTSDDSADRIVQLFITRGGVDYLLGSYTIPDLSGTNGVTDPAVNMFTYINGLPRDNDGQAYLLLESGDVLKAKSTTTVTAAKTISIHANYGDF